jgi:hypothetical protein
MSDNIDIDPGVTAGKKSVRTDEIAGIHYQVIKVAIGAPDSATDLTGGAGPVGPGVPRVTLASDDPLVAAFSTGIALKTSSAIVGKVGIDQTTDGTTNLVAAKQSGTWNVVNSAGANIIGKVGIDQTTDGTTNLVAAKQSGTWNLVNSAGSNIMGKVGIDQTTDGATNKVAADLRLAGTAVTAGAGAVASGTPRITMASDSPDVAALVAIRDATNTVNTADDTNTVYAGSTALTIKRGTISLTATGDLQALVVSKKIRVLSMMFVCSAALTVKLTSGTGPTDLTGAMSFVANGGMPFSESKKGLFETAVGAKLSMAITGTGTVSGFYTYVEV